MYVTAQPTPTQVRTGSMTLLTPSGAMRLHRAPAGPPVSRDVWVLCAVAFSVAVGFGIVAPALPVFARSFGVSRSAAGAVISVFALMRLVSALGSGRLVDRLGERRVLATGIAIVAVSSALAGLAGSYAQLVLLRGAGGLGSAMFSVSGMSLLLRSVAPELRGRAVGLFSGSFLLGGIMGPALGSEAARVSIRLPFFLYAGTLTVAGSIGLLLLPRPADAPSAPGRQAPRPRTDLREAFRNRSYVAALAANAADSWAVLGVRSALIPLFVVEVLDLDPRWTGAGFAIVAAVNGLVLLPAGRYADRRGRRPVLVAGTSILAVALATLAVAPSLAGYLVAMVLYGLGSGLLDVAPAAVVGDVVQGSGGTSVAAYQMAGDAGAVVGPVAAGQLAESVSYGAAFGLTSGVLGVATLLALLAPETRRDPAEAEAAPDPAAAEVPTAAPA